MDNGLIHSFERFVGVLFFLVGTCVPGTRYNLSCT